MTPYKGPDRRDSASEPTILAGVLSLGESTDHLAVKVEENIRYRKALAWLAITILIVILVQGVAGSIFFHQLNRLSNDNHALLLKAQSLTSPEAIKQQEDSGDRRVQEIIYCTVNLQRHSDNPSIPLDPLCPTSVPAPVANSSK